MSDAVNRGRIMFGVAIASMVLFVCAVLAVTGIFDDADVTLWTVLLAVSAVVFLGVMAVAVIDLARGRGGVIAIATLLVPVIPVSVVVLLFATATTGSAS